MLQSREMLYESWSLSPYMLVRTTGFAFELVEALNCPRTATLLLSSAEPQEIEETFQAELFSLLEHLGQVTSMPAFREALFLSSPNIFASLVPPRPDAPIRSKERKLIRHLQLYLQRLTTKCDTNSFFGPSWWGTMGQGQDLLTFSAPERFHIAQRYTLWTHWAVNALAQAIVRNDPVLQQNLKPRPAPGLTVEGRNVWLSDFLATPPTTQGPLTLNEAETQLLTRCIAHDGTLTRDDLTEGRPELTAALDSLSAQGLLFIDLQVPSGLAQPLEWLYAYLQKSAPSLKQRWLPLLTELEQARIQYQDGDLTERQKQKTHMGELFEATCQQAATRGEGTFYSDRALLCEEAVRNWHTCDIGQPLVTELQKTLLPLTYVLMDVQSLRHRLRQRAAAAWFRTTFSDESTVPLPRLLAAESDPALQRAFADVEDALQPLSSDLALWLCGGDPTQRRVELTPAALSARAENVELEPCVVNPDLMLGARSIAAANHGDYYLLLGELHMLQDLTIQCSSIVAHPDIVAAAQAMARQYERILPGVTVAEPVMEHTDKTKVQASHLLLQVEFSGLARDPLPSNIGKMPGTMRAGELLVRLSGERLCLTTHAAEEIQLTRTPVWSPFNRTSILNIFAFPHCNRLEGQVYHYPDGCTHFPRVTSGRMVLHRETWWLAPRPAWQHVSGYSLAHWRELRQWQDEQHLPEQVFARFSDEPKPVFVDFRNPLLVDWFVRKIGSATRPVTISEFLPGGSDLWLQDEQGHYCCEFRMTMYLAKGHFQQEQPDNGEIELS